MNFMTSDVCMYRIKFESNFLDDHYVNRVIRSKCSSKSIKDSSFLPLDLAKPLSWKKYRVAKNVADELNALHKKQCYIVEAFNVQLTDTPDHVSLIKDLKHKCPNAIRVALTNLLEITSDKLGLPIKGHQKAANFGVPLYKSLGYKLSELKTTSENMKLLQSNADDLPLSMITNI
ncbi:hypothetical protein [Vibrio alginolyticus]|uniref:hypothetical protein n=1 Tax=Vibrio TaxID=662 RepID=UPI0006CA9D65|nr:hypothetical protein [Vibrio alginolyticus]KPM97545.1 hypothetical protein AOG25_13830 [Vibrio alginolyticus]